MAAEREKVSVQGCSLQEATQAPVDGPTSRHILALLSELSVFFFLNKTKHMALGRDNGRADGRAIGAEQMGGGGLDQNRSHLCAKFSKNKDKNTQRIKLKEVGQCHCHYVVSSL